MLLGNLIKSIEPKYKKISINGISHNSKKVKRGHIFFAIEGSKTSGSKYIKEAFAKGASVIITDKKDSYKNFPIPVIFNKDVRKKLSEVCSNFYKKKPQKIIAVTGTNGKSSIVNFFCQLMSLNKVQSASIGTLGILSKKYSKKTNLTSIDPISLHKSLEIFKKNRVRNVILEASSHGLDQSRLDSLNINIGIFTNFSHDHLDYHKNMKSYLKAKMHLFNHLLKKNSKIIADEEIKEFKFIKDISIKRKIKRVTIGRKNGSIKILNNKFKRNVQVVKVSINSKIYILKIPLIGFFQVKNLIMAMLAASFCGLSLSKILKKLDKIKPVPGRLESIVNLNNNSNIIVDFAHTPAALEHSLAALKDQFDKEIILVFGCGGDRDKKKRFIMGKIAKKYCRKVFVTDDNPRNENPKKIRKAIIKGCKDISVEVGNRKKAIKAAIEDLGPNEILLVAGKGHETIQNYKNKIINFSDKKVIKKIIINKSFEFKNLYLKKFFNKKDLKNVTYDGVSINTKTLKKNNLFFAIKGKKNDGHTFVEEAVKKGAVKSVVSRKINNISKSKIIKVKNTFSTLNNFAKFTRSVSLARIIGVTGSAGKTTLKNLISYTLRNYGKVYHSPHSYNNRFGVPLSLSNLKPNDDYGVFEIGMDKKGEIYKLSKIVRPEIAVITNISEAHIENFSNLKGIAKAKSEIIDNVLDGGDVVLNKDDKFFNFLYNKAKKRKLNVKSFSCVKKADIFLLGKKKFKNHHKLKISVDNSIFYFTTKNITNNYISNILACISVLSILDLDLNVIKRKFNNFKIPEGRGNIEVVNKFKKIFNLIDESYNANPLSMKSAINNVNNHKKEKNTKKIIFLGDMLELGKKSKKLHRDLSSIINKSDIDKVFVYGKHIKETFNLLSTNKKGKVFDNLREAHNHFGKIVDNNDLIMIKGSNATGLNQFSKNIKKGKYSVI